MTFRAQHDFEFVSWLVRPKFDVGAMRIHADDATERGLAAAGIALEDYRETHGWVRPAVEIGKEFRIGAENRLRLNLEFGAHQYFNNSSEVHAQFTGAPNGLEPMVLEGDLGEPRYSAIIGVDFLTERNLVLQMYYQRSWSDHRDIDSLRFKLEYPF
jgi:hypothetical protein